MSSCCTRAQFNLQKINKRLFRILMQGYEMTSKLKIWDHAMEMISYNGKFSINFVCYFI